MSDLPVEANLEVHRGDSWSQPFQFSASGTPIDLSAATVAAEARDNTGALTPLVATVTDPTNGLLAISGSLASGIFDYDVQVTDGSGAVTTWVTGQLVVNQDVTP